ncbi:MAG: hypothetical protein AAGH41_14390 [Pseudomonadota bacterium]
MLKPRLSAQIKVFAAPLALFTVSEVAAQDLAAQDRDGLLERNRAARSAQPPLPEPLPTPLPEIDDDEDFAASATVHLASYYSDADALRGWRILSDRHPGALDALEPILRSVDLGERGQFVRLLAGPLSSAADADDLCATLRADGAYCAVSDLTGSALYPSKDFGR